MRGVCLAVFLENCGNGEYNGSEEEDTRPRNQQGGKS